jgi:phosphatidylserine/phosphatidylglycerophosphate/cardiolipin synthase-like enzyme
MGERHVNLRDIFDGLVKFRRSAPAAGYPPNLQHLFAPVDDVHGALMQVCNAAQLSLAAAMYGWDDDQIDQLFQTKLGDDRIPVTLALDKTQAAGAHEKQILSRWQPGLIGNAIVIGQSSKHAISHDKMIVVDGLVTITGSTNLSDSGERKQNNECLVVFDAVFAAEARARIDLIHSEMAAQMHDSHPTAG